jgi:hypothetical protein
MLEMRKNNVLRGKIISNSLFQIPIYTRNGVKSRFSADCLIAHAATGRGGFFLFF